MKLNKHILALCLLALTITASAYDAVGHRIVADIAIDLPRPRTDALTSTSRFVALASEVRGALRDGASTGGMR